MPRLLFFGGNGHCDERLTLVRRALAATTTPFELFSVPYPGFEDRPRSPSFEAFLEKTASSIAHMVTSTTSVYATGVGGLLFLCLRARGAFCEVPAVFQAPVLWGLEKRWMPRLMRLGFAQLALRRAFASPLFQRRFARKHFRVQPSQEALATFFEGYARCAALPDFFEWLTPNLLRTLEAALDGAPNLLDRIRFVWGAKDSVVPPAEIEWTEKALHRALNVQIVPEWGHYPMMDDPASWVSEVNRVAFDP